MYITPCGNEQVGEKGGVEAVLEAGVSHLSNAVVAEESCGCLHALVWGAQNKAAMVQLVGERVVVEAMRAHPNNLAVQFEAVACLAVLSFCVDDNKLRIGDAGAIPLILAAMRRFGTDGGLQGQGCFALWSLCSSTPPSMPGHDKDLAKIMVEQNRKDVVSGDGVGVVLGALHRQGGDVEVCELACRALGSVVYGNVATCGLAAKKVFDEGDRGLGRIAVLMGHHSSSPSFLTQAAFAIKNVVSELNKDEKNTKRDMGLQKLARPLTEAMRLHAGEISVHNQTVAALGNVAVNGMANKHMGMGGYASPAGLGFGVWGVEVGVWGGITLFSL
ncbi:hypothetical protein T484DRAFT_2227332 [Baffinella frigidus]|nr:hypothetical protein T484DRAFT_2227332 [Cryptophyta sp. CCMP2293]